MTDSRPIMTEDDWYVEAVRSRKGADDKLKHFAECCAMVSGKRTKDLAADCLCSTDTIEQYRNAYRLFHILDVNIESEHVRKLWKDIPIDVWKEAAKLSARYDLAPIQIYEYLEDAEGMGRNSFSAHVDEKENKSPKWVRRLSAMAQSLRSMGDDWKTEIEPELREEFDAWTEQGAELLFVGHFVLLPGSYVSISFVSGKKSTARSTGAFAFFCFSVCIIIRFSVTYTA